jgi:RHS repeat-associated protein
MHTNQTQSFGTLSNPGYDELNRLVSATGPYGAGGAATTITYAYDTIGNLTCNSLKSACSASTPNYAYANAAHAHAVTSAAGTGYIYDPNGNMIQRGADLITYDGQNRMASYAVSGGGSTNFVYDGDGGRVKKITASTTTTYIGKLYECVTGVCTKHLFAGAARIASKSVGSTDISYYHTDHLGSTSVVTDKNGVDVAEYVYRPFGETVVTSGLIAHYQYTGQEKDSETVLYFYNARYYDPALGRFVQADTVVPGAFNPQALNRYSYTENNPINAIDPSGHWPHLHHLKHRLHHAIHHYEQEVHRLATNQYIAMGIQAFGGPTGWAIGGWGLSQSDRGRNILAGEIVVGTAVATAAACSTGVGCAVAVSALMGESFGAYGAKQSGGDLLTGVAIGGLSGAAGGYAGGEAFGYVWSGPFTDAPFTAFLAGGVANGAVGGFIQGAGYTLAYGGSWGAAWRSGYQSAALGAEIGAVTSPFAYAYAQAANTLANPLPGGMGSPNVVGTNDPSWCQVGSICSKILTMIPGINATGVFHDAIPGVGNVGSVYNWATMVPSAEATYGALLNEAPSAPLTINQNEDNR